MSISQMSISHMTISQMSISQMTIGPMTILNVHATIPQVQLQWQKLGSDIWSNDILANDNLCNTKTGLHEPILQEDKNAMIGELHLILHLHWR
jgi:hypothetical protein